MEKKYTIVLNEEEKEILEKILSFEFDQEEEYQYRFEKGERDVEQIRYVAKILSKIWKAEYKPNSNLIASTIYNDLVSHLYKRIASVLTGRE